MKHMKILSLALALTFLVLMVCACGGTQEKGDPYTFTVTVITHVELDEQNNVVMSTGEEDADYEERLDGPTSVTLYREKPADGSEVQITLGEVIEKYLEQSNNDYTYIEEGNRYTRFCGINNQAKVHASWDFQVNGQTTNLNTVVSTEADIEFVYGIWED